MQTINDLEESAQAGLESLRDINQNNDLSSALELFLPDGLTPVVELIDENGRRKRGTAASWNWNPQTDKVRISFKPATSSSRTHSMRGANSPSQPAATNAASLSDSSQAEGSLQAESSSSQLPGSSNLSSSVESVTPQEIIECCQAVASAERSNRQLITLGQDSPNGANGFFRLPLRWAGSKPEKFLIPDLLNSPRPPSPSTGSSPHRVYHRDFSQSKYAASPYPPPYCATGGQPEILVFRLKRLCQALHLRVGHPGND
jgi:hypothetical protein